MSRGNCQNNYSPGIGQWIFLGCIFAGLILKTTGCFGNGVSSTPATPPPPTPTPAATPLKMTLGANFGNIQWNKGWSDYFKGDLDWATTSDPWNPGLIEELKAAKYKVLRFTDMVPTNNSATTGWEQRIAKTDNHYKTAGMAYEWQIDLCNKTGADIWVNIPHQADAGYAYQLAVLLKNQLNANSKVYVEWSNEVWNPDFAQYKWMVTHQIPGLPENLTVDGRTVYVDGFAGSPHLWNNYVYYACRTFNEFEKVFDKNSPRLVKVLAGWIDCLPGNGSQLAPMCDYHMAALNNAAINSWGVTVNAYALSFYWRGNTVGDMRKDLTRLATNMQYYLNVLQAKNIPLIGYAGGADGLTAANLDPGQRQLYIDALDLLGARLQGVFCLYNHVGFSPEHPFGLKKYTGQPENEAYKWQGLLQWVNSHP